MEDSVYWATHTNGELVYYDHAGADIGVWKALIQPGSIVVYIDPMDSTIGRSLCTTEEIFMDYLNPTDTERVLFELEFGFPYIDQELLEGVKK